MISVVCFRWKPEPGYRSSYSPDTVNTLGRMVQKHYPKPHRFICVTDDPTGLEPGVEVVPLWQDFAGIPSPHGGKNPSCYRRLRMFHPEIGALVGPRFVTMDLDCVVTGDLSPIFDRTEDFVMWGDQTNPTTHYNGSLLLMTAGARPNVWERFDPVYSPRESRAAGQFGSDQGWISHCLGGGEAKFDKRDGVYSFRCHLGEGLEPLPADARVVFFHGRHDPWSPRVAHLAWIQEHYLKLSDREVAA